MQHRPCLQFKAIHSKQWSCSDGQDMNPWPSTSPRGMSRNKVSFSGISATLWVRSDWISLTHKSQMQHRNRTSDFLPFGLKMSAHLQIIHHNNGLQVLATAPSNPGAGAYFRLLARSGHWHFASLGFDRRGKMALALSNRQDRLPHWVSLDWP